MREVATALLFDRTNRLLIYKRDQKPSIAYPGHWDLFGGMVEEGETPELALVRELKEELGLSITNFVKIGTYTSDDGIGQLNTKHIFLVKVLEEASELTLYEGEVLKSIPLKEHSHYQFANVLNALLLEFFNSEAAKPYK